MDVSAPTETPSTKAGFKVPLWGSSLWHWPPGKFRSIHLPGGGAEWAGLGVSRLQVSQESMLEQERARAVKECAGEGPWIQPLWGEEASG